MDELGRDPLVDERNEPRLIERLPSLRLLRRKRRQPRLERQVRLPGSYAPARRFLVQRLDKIAAAEGVDGFVTISGGKTTTARAMAEATADLVSRKVGDRVSRSNSTDAFGAAGVVCAYALSSA